MKRHKPQLGGLSASDAELLAQAYRQVIPIKGHARVTHEPAPHQSRSSAQAQQRQLNALATANAPARLSDGDPASLEQVPESYRASGIASQALRRLRREGDGIRECLDLHGLTRDQARLMLKQFIDQACLNGVRCVRIIHGQGYGSAGGASVLRYLTRHWLTQMPQVSGFVTPNPAQGGKGAVLVLLRLAQSGHERDD